MAVPACLIVSLAVAVGCGGESASIDAGTPDRDGSSDGEVLTASDYCESIVDPFCGFYLRCGRMAVSSVAECTDAFLEACNASFESQYIDLEAAGLLALSEQGVAACASHLGSVECERQVFELDGPCADMWTGTQGAEEACGLNVDFFVCAPENECVIGLDFCGECQPVIELAGDCTDTATTCGASAFCDEGTCKARVGNGMACGDDDRCMTGANCLDAVCLGPVFVAAGAPCDRDNRCPYLTACIEGTCQPTARLGEPCSEIVPCETGFCAEGICEAPKPNGEICGHWTQCQSGQCVDTRCEPRPGACLR